MGMIRRHENPLAVRAGVLSVLVHGILLTLLLMSFNWKTIQPASISEVELWDKLPSQPRSSKSAPPAKQKPVEREVKEVKEIKKAREPEPTAEPEPKAEIQLKKKPLKEPKPKEEKPVKKPPEEKKPVKQQEEEPEQKPVPDPALKAQKEKEKLRKLQQTLAAEDQQAAKSAQKAEAQAAKNAQASAANKAAMEMYMEKIRNKIRQYVNPQLCGSGKPEMLLAVHLLPTGEVSGTPRITKSSGISACDESVERALLQAQPLPVPSEAELFNEFRSLNLKFRPLE